MFKSFSCSVKTIQSNRNAIWDLSTTLIVINSCSYSVSSDSTSETFPQICNTGLIIGLVLGIVGIIFAYRKYDKQHKLHCLFIDPNSISCN